MNSQSSTKPETGTRRLLVMVWLAGLLPLIAGVTIFGLWMRTEHPTLVTAGLVTLGLGSLSLLFGLVVLMIYVLYTSQSTTITRRRVLLNVISVSTLYLITVAAGLFCASQAIAMMTRYKVTIVNQSSVVLKDVRIVGGGPVVELGELAPGGRVVKILDFEGDSSLWVEATQGDAFIRVVVEEYVTSLTGGRKRVIFHDAGKTKVKAGHGLMFEW